MRTLIYVICILSLVLISSLVAIIAATYHSTSRWESLITNADGSRCSQPCLFGITPGIQLYSDSTGKIKSHPILRPDNTIPNSEGIGFFYGSGQREGTSYTSKSKVTLTTLLNSGLNDYSNSLEVKFSDDAPLLGDVLLLLGKPSELWMNLDERIGKGSVFFYFESNRGLYTMIISIDNVHASLTPDSKIKAITFNELQMAYSYPKIHWTGFRPYIHYWEIWKILTRE